MNLTLYDEHAINMWSLIAYFMVSNDNVVVSLFIFLIALAVFLGVALLVLFDFDQLLTASVFNPNVSTEIITEPTPGVVVGSPEPEVENVRPGLDMVPYPVLDIEQPDQSLFAPSVGDRGRLSQTEQATLCANGFEQPGQTAGCMYWEGLISSPVDYFE